MIHRALQSFQLELEKIKNIKSFEKDILDKIKNEKPEILETIQSSGKLEKEVEDSLIKIIEDYKKK